MPLGKHNTVELCPLAPFCRFIWCCSSAFSLFWDFNSSSWSTPFYLCFYLYFLVKSCQIDSHISHLTFWVCVLEVLLVSFAALCWRTHQSTLLAAWFDDLAIDFLAGCGYWWWWVWLLFSPIQLLVLLDLAFGFAWSKCWFSWILILALDGFGSWLVWFGGVLAC